MPVQLDFDKFHLGKKKKKLEMNSNFSYKKLTDLDKSDLIKDKLVNNVTSTHNKNVIKNNDSWRIILDDNLPKDSY